MVREPDILKALLGIHVLVADADPGARDLLESVLTYCGAFVTMVASGRAALASLDGRRIDVVVANVEPGREEDGASLARELAGRAGRALPVIALVTGGDHGSDRPVPAGFQGHLRKPVDPWEMCRMIASLARRA